MTPPKKSPTNADIEAKLDQALKEMKAMTIRLGVVEQWKVSEEAYKAARADVMQEEAESKKNQQDAELKSSMIKTLKDLSPVLTAAGILLYALIEGLGK